MLNITNSFLKELLKEYLNNKEKIILTHKYVLNNLDKNITLLKNGLEKNYHIFLTDNNFTIVNTTFKYDKGFSLFFLKKQFISHKNKIHVSLPICEPATTDFFSFSDSYQNNKVLQIGYIYHSKKSQEFKKQLKIIKEKNPFIKNIIIYFIHPKSKFAQKCQIIKPIYRKYSLKEMENDKKFGLELYKKLQNKNPIFTTTNMYMLYKDPLNQNNDLILKIDIDENYLIKQLTKYKFILLFLGIIFILIILATLLFINKILDSLDEFATHIKNEKEYNKKFNNEFDEVINSYNTTLSKMKNLIKDRENFLHFIVHELKTPLSIISLNVDSKNELLSYSIKMLSNSYNDMVYFLKLKKTPINIQKIELDKLLLDRIKYFKEYAQFNKKKIIYNIEKSCIEADLLDIERLIDNNITNAIKYSTSKNIYINLKNNILSFENEGVIKEKNKIFNKFYTTKGFGIGLSIVKNIVQKYNIKLNLKTDNKIIFEYDLKEIICK